MPNEPTPDAASASQTKPHTVRHVSSAVAAVVDAEIPATAEAVRDLLVSVGATLGAGDLHPDLANSAEVVLGEALNNVVEHAYGESGEGWLRLAILQVGEALDVTLTDGGAPMPGRQLPDGLPQDVSGPLEDLPEGGFGWFLIRSMTVDLKYTRLADTNRLTFRLTAQ